MAPDAAIRGHWMNDRQRGAPPDWRQPRLAAVILAAGSGKRMGGVEKQFLAFRGRPVVAHSLGAFLAHPATVRTVVVAPPGRKAAAKQAIGEFAGDGRVLIVEGGARRQDSLERGVDALDGDDIDVVAVHDAARPLLKVDMISRLIEPIAEGAIAALPVLDVVDTLKRVKGANVEATQDRRGLVRAQTPQVIRLDAFAKAMAAHDKGREITDDVSLVEQAGGRVATVKGDEALMKLTDASDLGRLDAHAAAQAPGDGAARAGGVAAGQIDVRTGNAFDVHGFSDKPGPLVIGGVEIDSKFGLDAHSDGDVAIHAICDAIFGALADGDIGAHFPPSDAKWKDADSARFLEFAAARAGGRGAVIMHLDVTVICEQPKIGPHRDAMRKRIAGIAGIDVSRVGVKATTCEGLGFIGRGQGIAAQATATLSFGAATRDAPSHHTKSTLNQATKGTAT